MNIKATLRYFFIVFFASLRALATLRETYRTASPSNENSQLAFSSGILPPDERRSLLANSGIENR